MTSTVVSEGPLVSSTGSSPSPGVVLAAPATATSPSPMEAVSAGEPVKPAAGTFPTDGPVASETARTKPTKAQVSQTKKSSVAGGPTRGDLKGTVALSVVASSHASLNEALKRLRLEFESIKSSGASTAICDKALSTIDSLLIEAESLLKDLVTRSHGETPAETTEAGKKRRANAKKSSRRSNSKKDEGKQNTTGSSAAGDGAAGASKEQPVESPRRVPMNRTQNRRMPLSGIFGTDRHIRGPPMYYSPPHRIYRVDETVMQYRSPHYYSLINETRFPLPPSQPQQPPSALQATNIASSVAGRKQTRQAINRERESVNKKNKMLAREREEAAIRNELRNATTIQQFTELMEKANKLGMQFEVAAVNSRVAKLQEAAQLTATKNPAPTNSSS
eukprot:Gregarina_sp_Poly_1__4067@NODE_2235_length_2429_cov_621_916173_g1436_i0_p1_GENE_NODE_2235_length_2429_cov_621_916173_g1436_i0NODE_2235_length_2429_cov_621_916173_g1436_i0_p1_ORF_typecomplete_len391_score73_40DUF5045/PF16464_5/0_052_NODE_2235_length_2429_cov_621_916173_g1436_i03491521